MDKVLRELGYSDREIRTLNDFEKRFLIDNNEIIPKIKEQIIEKYPKIPENKILVSIMMSLGDYVDDLFVGIRDIIKSEQRDFKISKLLSESKIYKFSDFNKLF